MKITIAADDLPELWEEYVIEKGYKRNNPPENGIGIKFKLALVEDWLFGGKEDDGDSGRG